MAKTSKSRIAIIIVLGFLGIIGAVLFYASSKPNSFHVERSITVKAPPEKIFPLINDFHNWTQWSPWEKLDPALKRTYSGPQQGEGTNYAWEGNNKVGAGNMLITDSIPSSKISIKLDFLKPFEGHNTADFSLNPKDDTTRVTWTMYGEQPFMGKVMGLFMDMDSMIGKDFESGLANLKVVAEK